MTRQHIGLLALCLAIGLPIACTAPTPSDDPVTGNGDGDTMAGDGDINIGDGDISTGDGDLVVIDQPPTANCGDGTLDDDEACDDANMNNEDGCGSNCRYVEDGWVCPDAGQPCRRFAKCGDGTPVFPEQCDDANLENGDGCSATCKIEIGSKCEGSPSVCSPSTCGDATQEGAETCDDANGLPFDGCSELCQGEPVCGEDGCTTTCGDGLIIGDEQCDDGNAIDGDGCSSSCQQEPGYECSQAPPCPDGAEDCPIDLPIVFRDFDPTTNSDFQAPDPPGTENENRPCDGFNPGIAAPTLGPDGKPVFASAPPKSCTSDATFSQWYVDSSASSTILGSIRLYPNGEGGYVNRYGANGEPYLTAVATPDETNMGQTLAECQGQRCVNAATNAQEMFDGLETLRCDDDCRSFNDTRNQRENELMQLENQLLNATDPDAIEMLEAQIATLEADIEQLTLDYDTCQTDCQTELDARIAECADQCAPCSNPDAGFCTGGELRELDGDPLFFPIDDHPDALPGTLYGARIPAQIYNGLGWPWEDTACGLDGTCNTTLLHNFHFTSEIAYWFEYQEDMVADLTFIGDDDVFVYVNRRLVIDLGGIHVPLGGQFTLAGGGAITTRVWQAEDPGVPDEEEDLFDDTTQLTAADLGLVAGNVYEIKVFHAERKPEGSSFQLTLSGFNTARSECSSICGDGILAAGEECDNGAEFNVGGHNGCEADCTLGAYCGDGVVQPDVEQCDDADPNAPGDCSGCRILVVR